VTEELIVLRLLWQTPGCSLSNQQRPCHQLIQILLSVIVPPPHARMFIRALKT